MGVLPSVALPWRRNRSCDHAIIVLYHCIDISFYPHFMILTYLE